MSKIKILLFGPISDPESEKLFVSKINALHSSKAGPFDVAFVVGRSTIDSLKESNFPFPVYLHGLKGAQECENIESLGTNLHVLSTGVKSISITNKGDLIVATLPWNIRVDSQPELMNHFKHACYTGCDLLLSHEWPQGIESCMNAAANALMSFDVAHVALQARARYHVSVGDSFQQSTAFDHLPSITQTVKTLHVGRFLSIAPIRNNSTKDTKYVHAVGISPLHSMSTAELNEQRPAVVQPCPFTDTSYQKMNEPLNGNGKSAGANLSEASIRRIMNEERTRDQPQQHRWATKRSRNDDTPIEVDPNCTTLFVHGLHYDVSGRLQLAESGDPLLQNVFSKFNLQSIRRPASSSSFCFLEFATHEHAEKCLEQFGGHVRVEGVELTLKWGSSSGKTSNADSKRQRLTESEAKDSSTVYFKLPPSVFDVKLACENLRKWMENTLEDALAGPDDTEKVTAETEPALRVQARLPQDGAFFGFMDFASHAAASMALATLTGSTDGGRLLTDATGKPSQDLDGLYLHWAKADKRENGIIEDSSGFRFERQHFPADSRKDCWFCLASEDCEKHLITGVYDLCYSAMPKGPVHPGHVLLIPVHHSSKGAFADPAVAEEIESTKRMLREHASRAYDMDLFVFERAIETIHGYHTHVQCVPVERGLGVKLQATMMAQANKIGVHLRELSSDLNLKAVITDDDDSAGYFYIEVPDSRNCYKRFLYKHNTDSGVRVPLQFGREILAAVLGKPQLAHWKSCVLDRDQEAALAASLRMSLNNEKQSEHEE
jgi:diadenosine tetraphosphate (Ap4A) HIT family hydrolase